MNKKNVKKIATIVGTYAAIYTACYAIGYIGGVFIRKTLENNND